MTVFFNAETIIVEGNSRYSAAQILEQGGLKVGQNLFRLDKFKVIDQMKELPYVKEVTIRRQLPSKLKITVLENEPVVWLATPSGAALMNEYYRVLEYVDYIPPVPAPEPPAEESEPSTEEEQPAEETNVEEAGETEPEAAEGEEEPSGEEQPGPEEEESAMPEKLIGVPQLILPDVSAPEVGKTLAFAAEADYTGFLERLYLAFQNNPELDWKEVGEVRFKARYDISLSYHQTVTIEFGTLDQADTKVELAAYLLKDNGVSQSATLDVSNVERVYYRPQK